MWGGGLSINTVRGVDERDSISRIFFFAKPFIVSCAKDECSVHNQSIEQMHIDFAD